jgi:hypothetical protein
MRVGYQRRLHCKRRRRHGRERCQPYPNWQPSSPCQAHPYPQNRHSPPCVRTWREVRPYSTIETLRCTLPLTMDWPRVYSLFLTETGSSTVLGQTLPKHNHILQPLLRLPRHRINPSLIPSQTRIPYSARVDVFLIKDIQRT